MTLSRRAVLVGGGAMAATGLPTLVDAQAGVETSDGRWRFQLWGRNLTNEVYATTLVRRQEAIVRTTGMPVTYGARVSWRF